MQHFAVVIVSLICLCCNEVIGKCVWNTKAKDKHEVPPEIFPLSAGGEPVKSEFKYPFVVNINHIEADLLCGAAIISNRFVLSAAHCLPKDFKIDKNGVVDPETVKKVTLSRGGSNFSLEYEFEFVDWIIVHPEYYPDKEKDIMLLKLKEPISFRGSFQPIDFPIHTEFEREGTILTLAGWGKTENGKQSLKLMEVDLTVWSEDKCKFNYATSPFYFCAGEDGSSACDGDSGGPLFKEENGKFFIVGILSQGGLCGIDPNRFTRVSYFMDWIVKNSDLNQAKL